MAHIPGKVNWKLFVVILVFTFALAIGLFGWLDFHPPGKKDIEVVSGALKDSGSEISNGVAKVGKSLGDLTRAVEKIEKQLDNWVSVIQEAHQDEEVRVEKNKFGGKYDKNL